MRQGHRIDQKIVPVIWPGWVALSILFFVLYAATANRGVQWQDSGYYILRVLTGELINPRGLALTHPLHYYLSALAVRVLPCEPCFSITLISVLFGALTIANVYGAAVTVTRHRPSAFLAALSLGVAHTMWQMSTKAEVYTITTSLLALELWCLVSYARRQRPHRLYALFFLNGLNLANDLQAVLTTPIWIAVLIIALRQRRLSYQHAVFAGILWVVGSSPYTSLIVSEWVRTGGLWSTIHSALFGHEFAGAVLNPWPSLRDLAICGGFLLLNFPNLTLPSAILGLARARHEGISATIRWAFLCGLLLHTIFALRYNVVDQYTFLLPTYLLAVLYAAVGWSLQSHGRLVRSRTTANIAPLALLAFTPLIYSLMPSMARRIDLLSSLPRKPYRDNAVYLFAPWSISDGSADRMSRHAVALAGENGIIVVRDRMAEFAVRYRLMREEMSGVQIERSVTPEITRRATEDRRPIVLIPIDADAPRLIPEDAPWQRLGDLYLLNPRDE